MFKWLKHAFAIDPPGAADPGPDLRPFIDRLCHEVVRRRLTTPALIALEMSRPLNNVGAHAMHFFSPLVWALTDADGFDRFAKYLEKRGSIEFLCQRLEELEHESGQVSAPAKPDQDKTAECEST